MPDLSSGDARSIRVRKLRRLTCNYIGRFYNKHMKRVQSSWIYPSFYPSYIRSYMRHNSRLTQSLGRSWQGGRAPLFAKTSRPAAVNIKSCSRASSFPPSPTLLFYISASLPSFPYCSSLLDIPYNAFICGQAEASLPRIAGAIERHVSCVWKII